MEAFDAPESLSVRHVTSKARLGVCFPEPTLPCKAAIDALVPLSRAGVTIGGESHPCDLLACDALTMWLDGFSSGDRVVAACKGGDSELFVFAWRGGAGGLPATAPNDAAPTLADLADAGATVVCAGRTEARILREVCAACVPAVVLEVTIDERAAAEAGADTGAVAFFRPRGNVHVHAALATAGAVAVGIPTSLRGAVLSSRLPLVVLTPDRRLTAPCLLCGDARLDANPLVRSVLSALVALDPWWLLGELNMASRFLPLLESTREALRPLEHAASSRAEADPVVDIGIPEANLLRV